MFNPLHIVIDKELYENHLYYQSSHCELYRRINSEIIDGHIRNQITNYYKSITAYYAVVILFRVRPSRDEPYSTSPC